MNTAQSIDTFLKNKKIAVAGVSRKKQKFGNAIYKELQGKGFELFPVNPNLDEYQGQKCYHSLMELPGEVEAVVISTKNDTSMQLVREAKAKGIQNIWLQQGAMNKETLKGLHEPDLNIIAKECILMHAGPVKGIHGFHRWLKKSFGSLPV